MKPTILAIRAVGAEFARRMYLPVAILAIVIIVAFASLTAWLISLSAWWWLLMFAVVSSACIAISVLTVLYLTIRRVTPDQNPIQHKAVRGFVDKIQLLSDTVGTPKVVLLFRIIKDIAAPRADGFIGSLTGASATVKKDFEALIKLFDDRYIDA